MSPPHAYTTGVISSMHHSDDEDDDICPICEGACTCNNNKLAPPVAVPVASTSRQTHTQIPLQSLSSPPIPTHPVTAAPLKIKLTIPATLLARARLSTSSALPPTIKKFTKSHSQAKRLGRPAKAVARASPYASPPSQKRVKSAPKSKFKGKGTTGKPSKRKVTVGSDDDYTPNGADTAALRRSHNSDADGLVTAFSSFVRDQDDTPFPTFVSADESSSVEESSAGSSSSDSEESDLTDFSDSSIEAEEENYILRQEQQRAHAHDKARVKRELLGDGVMKRKELRNDWEIHSRKKSVGPSDDEMDVDSDETEDEAEEGVEEADGNGEDDEDEADGRPTRGSYAGIGTGWSDDESSFDADLFLAGLSDSDSGPDLPSLPDQGAATADGDDSSLELDPTSLAHGVFEITEGWDGSVIFTNGLQDGQGLLDWDFEANAAQLLIEAAAISEASSASDTDIRMSDGEGDMGDSEDADDSLEEVESNDGDTTEEELVDERGLPTARAMRLFRPPVTPLSSINPLSTMSPGPRVQDVFSHQSPKPSDILAGRGFGDDDEEDAPEPPMSEIGSIILSASSDRGTPRFPLMGMFEASSSDFLRRAVIDGSCHDAPSPFQRTRRRRLSESVSARSISRGRGRSQSLSHASNAMSPTPFGIVLPALSDNPTLPTSPDLPLTEPIRLDDVLDTSILDSDPIDAPSTPVKSYSIIGEPDTSATEDGGHHLQSLDRWDRIPMGTFRRTREIGPLSDGPSDLTFGGAIRSSPFSGVWPSDRNSNQESGSPSKKGKGKKNRSQNRMGVVISPVIMPVRDRDGDHTPTGHASGQNSHNPLHSKSRKDKESRRDKTLKRKSLMGTATGRRPPQYFHNHGHHPNAKGRASGSMQRAGFFSGGSVPPLNL
ncbi:hypothetical protein BC834DRAFT_840888 [Gloeopeniophorella convolvens]|nr:hypothetical protein BC834DRAFT_840888 [Gloeopeniophorella convolvens]